MYINFKTKIICFFFKNLDSSKYIDEVSLYLKRKCYFCKRRRFDNP